MMFVSDGSAAVREIARTTRPGGRIAVATWAAVEESPGYLAMVDLLREELGEWAADALRAPFGIGTADQLGDLLRTAFPAVRVERRAGQATFRSLDEWLHCDIRGWTLADYVDDEQFARLRHRAESRFAQFVGADGRVCFAVPALIATATR
jgi:SAM-dependent methyltransferase